MAKQQQQQMQHASTFSGGMNKDLDVSLFKPEMYIHAKNLRLVSDENNSTGALENVKGNKRIIDNTKDVNYSLVGYAVNGNKAILFYTSSSHSAIYQATFKDDKRDEHKEIYNDSNLSESLGFNSNTLVSAVLRKENEEVERLYWLDGSSGLKHLNIAAKAGEPGSPKNKNGDYVEPSSLSPSPSFPFKDTSISLDSIGSGSLKSGMVQYAYQFISSSGGRSPISPTTGLFHITKSNESAGSTIDYGGTEVDEDCNKSFTLQIDISQDSTIPELYDEIRVYSIHRKTISGTPLINELRSINLSKGVYRYKALDGGDGYMSTISLVEFLVESSASTSSSSIISNAKEAESKDNRLFLADIETKELGLDIGDYDPRAFRFDSSQKCVVENEYGESWEFDYFSTGFDNAPPLDHDAITPSNYNSAIKEVVSSLKLTNSPLDFTASSGTKSTTVKASHSWEISDAGQASSWITDITPQSGTAGDTAVSITVAGNTGDYRSDSLTFSLVGYSDSVGLGINQEAPYANIEPKDSYSLDSVYVDDEDRLHIGANISQVALDIDISAVSENWELVNNNYSWIKFHTGSDTTQVKRLTGDGNLEFYLDANENTSGEQRIGKISLRSTDYSDLGDDLTIVQDTMHIEICEGSVDATMTTCNQECTYRAFDQFEYTENDEETDFGVAVPGDPTASSSWSAVAHYEGEFDGDNTTSSIGWLTVADVELYNNRFQLALGYNGTGSIRTGYVTVYLDSNQAVNDTVEIEQSPAPGTTISVSPTDVNVPATSTPDYSFDLTITTSEDPDNDAPWTVTTASWVSTNLSDDKGSGDDVITIIVEDNGWGVDRYSQVSVSLDENTDSAACGINQSA